MSVPSAASPPRIEATALRRLGAVAFTTTRAGPGVSTGPYASFNLADHVGDDPDAVVENRRELVRSYRLPGTPRYLAQVHGARVVDWTRRYAASVPEADASVTMRISEVLCVLTADCLPVVLVAHAPRAIACVHAGWRGLAAGVVTAAVARLRADGATVSAWLGPAIGPEAYIVGDEVRAQFAPSARDRAFEPASSARWHCDLYALARGILERAGVEAVGGGDHCTFRESDLFYSYRRDGTTGRMATIAWLE